MASFAQLAKKLQQAINNSSAGAKLLINTSQWYSDDKKRPVTCYIVKQNMKDEKGKNHGIELFKTYSHVQLVLWLRDYWYELNGWEVPHDNEVWEEVKDKYYEASYSKRNREQDSNG